MIMSNCATLMLFMMVVCVFIANAKTTQAPDSSTLRCLLLKWKVLKQGSERRIGLTDFTD